MRERGKDLQEGEVYKERRRHKAKAEREMRKPRVRVTSERS